MGWQDDSIVAKGKPKWESDPIITAATDASTATPDTPLIDIAAGVAVPTIIASSANPYSAGRYPLGRVFTVGDAATFRQSDIFTGLEERTYTRRVTRVDYDADRVEYNNGNTITDLMGNLIKTLQAEYDVPVQWTPAEFQIGKKWTAAFHLSKNDKSSNAYYDMQIVRRETISVPAGSFDTFRIEGEGWNTTFGNRIEVKLWLVPGLNFAIKSESIARGKKGRFKRSERHELVSLLQHTIDSTCATPTGGVKRSHVVKSNCAV